MKQEDIEIGTPVIYWKIIKDDGSRLEPVKTEITSEPWKLGHGDMVCKVEGISGGVMLTHLDPITTGSLMAAKLQGLKDITEGDIIDAGTKFFNDNGVDVEFKLPPITWKNNEILIEVDETCEMASVSINDKCVMEGNFWDFHNGCQGINNYGKFNSYNELALAIKATIGGEIKEVTYEYED